MIRRYGTPGSFKAALEDRLRNQATRDRADLQRLRQMMVFDRFLARLFLDDRGDVVLKGGLVLEMRTHRARATKDVDLRLMGQPGEALARLQEAGRADLGDFLTFEIAVDPRHPTIEADGLHYEGRRYRVEARLAGKVYARPFGVDVAFAEPIVGEPDTLHGLPWLEFAGIAATVVRAYPVATHVAEKLHAFTLPRPTPNSRVKDLPDIAILGTIRPLTSAELRAAIDLTFRHRGTHPVPDRLPAAPLAWAAPYADLARRDGLAWPDLEAVTAAARTFVDPVLANAREVAWTPGEGWR